LPGAPEVRAPANGFGHVRRHREAVATAGRLLAPPPVVVPDAPRDRERALLRAARIGYEAKGMPWRSRRRGTARLHGDIVG
jgi:hypothetical protein